LKAAGTLLLVDQRGNVVNSSVNAPELGSNVADQNFFKVMQDKDAGLLIDRPSKTQQKDDYMITYISFHRFVLRYV
jgi:acyl CoA:acetate/3-ketoacid CoA transferase beta subunit